MPEVAWITGTSRGLGAAIATRLLADGHTVVGFARSEPRPDHAATGRLFAERCDLLDRQARRRAFDHATQAHGAPAIVIHNAGLGGPHRPLTEIDDTQWHDVLELAATVAFELTRRCLPAMQQRRSGRIVHIASVLGLAACTGSAAYIAAKHALVGLVRATAAENAAFGITCNAVCPGYLDTGMTAGPRDPDLQARLPGHRLGAVDDVAALVAWLCSPAAAFVNGAAIPVDGGLLADLGTGQDR